jgi:WD40 repeat protein
MAGFGKDEILETLVCEQGRLWRDGRRPSVEELLAGRPELGESPSLVVDLIYHEFLLRERAGEAPDVEEYARRFPRLADELRQQLALHRATSPPTVAPEAAGGAGATPAPSPSADLLGQARRLGLLGGEQLAECERLAADPAMTAMGFGREMLRRGWLTAFQVNHLLAGRGGELALAGCVLLSRLGGGGMGEVFAARRADGVEVAVKVIRAELLGSSDAVRRFQREARVVLGLGHPNVVRALESGQHGAVHFLIMERIDGLDAAAYLARKGAMPVAAACEVIRQAALGLQHAHEAGLVHRDVKPSNLMLQRPPAGSDQFPTVKLLDLGLARRDRAAGQISSELTQTGATMGTPDYLAPEQIRDPRAVGARSDLYSLGCTLYHLLAGRPPFADATVGLKLLQHQTEEPPPLVDSRPDLHPGVARLVRRLMSKRPEDRPASAAEVAAELARLLRGGRLSQARPLEALAGDDDSIIRGLRDFGKRPAPNWRRLLFAVATATALVGAVGWLVVWLTTASPKPQETPEAEDPSPLAKLRHEDLSREQLTGWVNDGTKWPARSLVAVLGSQRGRQWGMAEHLAVSPDGKRAATSGRQTRQVIVWDTQTLEPVAFLRTSGPVHGLGFYDDGLIVTSHDGNAHVLFRWRVGEQATRTPGAFGRWFSADGSRALDSRGAGAALLDAHTGRKLYEATGLAGGLGGGDLLGGALDGNGRQALLPGKRKGDVIRINARDGDPLETYAGVYDDWPWTLAFLPDGKRFLVGGKAGLRLVTPGKPPRILTKSLVACAAVSADGKRALAAAQGGLLELDLAEKGREARLIPSSPRPLSCAWLPGDRALTADVEGNVRLWDLASGKELLPRDRPPGQFNSVAFSPGGDRVVVGGAGGWLRCWDVASGKEQAFTVEPAGAEVTTVGFSPDGGRLLYGDGDGRLRLLEAGGGRARTLLEQSGTCRCAAYAPAGGLIFSAAGRSGAKGTADEIRREYAIRAVDEEGKEKFRCEGHTAPVAALSFSADGQRMLSGSELLEEEQTVRFWKARDGKFVFVRGWAAHAGGNAVALSPDGRWAVAGGNGREVHCFDLDQERPVWSRPVGFAVCGLAVTRSGLVAVACRDGRLVLLDRKKGEMVGECRLPGRVWGLALAPDGRHLATANDNGTAYVIRLPGG